jgi:hypothetical protein
VFPARVRRALPLVSAATLALGVIVGDVSGGVVAAAYWFEAAIVVSAGVFALLRAGTLTAEIVVRWVVGIWAAGVFVVEVFGLGPNSLNPIPVLAVALGGTAYAVVALVAILLSDLQNLYNRMDPLKIAMRSGFVLIGLLVGKVLEDQLQVPIAVAAALCMIALKLWLDLADVKKNAAAS